MPEGRRPRGATPSPRSGRGGGRKELPHVQGAVAARAQEGLEELFHIQGQGGKLKWAGMGEFNSDDHYIYYCGQESLRRNAIAIMVNKRVQNAVLGCNLRNDRMISVGFQDKPFNIIVVQVYVPTSNAEEAEVERFYEDLQDLLELIPKKDVLVIIGDWNAKVGSQETPGVTGKFGLGCVCVYCVETIWIWRKYSNKMITSAATRYD